MSTNGHSLNREFPSSSPDQYGNLGNEQSDHNGLTVNGIADGVNGVQHHEDVSDEPAGQPIEVFEGVDQGVHNPETGASLADRVQALLQLAEQEFLEGTDVGPLRVELETLVLGPFNTTVESVLADLNQTQAWTPSDQNENGMVDWVNALDGVNQIRRASNYFVWSVVSTPAARVIQDRELAYEMFRVLSNMRDILDRIAELEQELESIGEPQDYDDRHLRIRTAIIELTRSWPSVPPPPEDVTPDFINSLE